MNDISLLKVRPDDNGPFDPLAIALRLAEERPADLVEVLNQRAPEEAAEIIEALPPDQAVEAFDQPGLDAGAEILALLPVGRAAAYSAKCRPTAPPISSARLTTRRGPNFWRGSTRPTADALHGCCPIRRTAPAR